MKVSKAIRKIVALGVGATMMGATIMGATAAADLKDYPAFFVKNGNFDGVLVVRGDEDSLAAVDIAANMMVASTTGTSGTKTTTTVSGDAWLVGTSSKKLEMLNNNATASAMQGENFRDINTFIGDEELKALGDGKWTTNEQEYNFQQFLFFDDVPANNRLSSVVKYSENDDDVTADHFFIANSRQIGRYRFELTSSAETDVTDSSGSADSTGLFLDDFEDTDLTLWGKSYNVVQAKRLSSTTTNGANVKLVLMSGPQRDTLLEGESKTYTLDDKEYTVELSFVDTDEAVFLVNGEKTNKLKEGETYKLKSKKEVGVSEILYQDYAGGLHSSTFYLGATTMELRDNDILNATTTSHDLRIGGEDIDGAKVFVTGTNDNTTLTITSIEVNMTAQDDYWVGVGKKLSDVIAAAGDEKEVLFGGAFDIEYKGLTGEETHDIRLKTSSARRYRLTLFDGDGKAVDVPVAYAEGQFNLSFGEETRSGGAARTNHKMLVINESNQTAGGHIAKDDFFIITGGTQNPASDGSAKSYLLQYRNSDAQTKSSPKIKFKNLGSGETLEYSISTISAGTTGTIATIKLGGYSFLVQNASSLQVDDFQISVDLDGGGAVASTDYITFVDSYGSEWHFDGSNNFTVVGNDLREQNGTDVQGIDFITLEQGMPNADDYDNQMPTNLIINITGAAGPELRAALLGNTSLFTPDGETEVAYGYTGMGTWLKFTSPSSDPNELTMTYPKEQRLPQVFITAGATTASTATGAGGAKTRVTIPVGVTKLPDEVTDVAAQNIITVGGPCANSVTAEVMYTKQGKSVPDNCAEGFKEGEAMIAVYDVDSKVAMVVAGYTGADTRRAGRVIASRAGELSGKQVAVQGTTASSAEIVKVS